MPVMRADLHARFVAVRDRALAKHAAFLDGLRASGPGTYQTWTGKTVRLSDSPRWKALGGSDAGRRRGRPKRCP